MIPDQTYRDILNIAILGKKDNMKINELSVLSNTCEKESELVLSLVILQY